MKNKPLLLAFLALSSAYANAAVIFSEDFDSGAIVTPKWVQAGGSSSASTTYSVSPSYSGALQGANTWLYTRGFTQLPTATTAGVIEVSFDVRFNAANVNSRLIGLQNRDVQYSLAGLLANASGEFQLTSAGKPVIGTYKANTWYHITFNLSLQARTYDISIYEQGGALVGSLSAIDFHSAAALDLGTLYFYNDASAKTTYIDNVLIQSIPEPAALPLLGLAGAVGAVVALRRRKLV